MAYLDWDELDRKEKQKLAYDKLKEKLRDSKHFELVEFLGSMENEIKIQAEKIREYQDFFHQLDKFLPARWSEHDLIS